MMLRVHPHITLRVSVAEHVSLPALKLAIAMSNRDGLGEAATADLQHQSTKSCIIHTGSNSPHHCMGELKRTLLADDGIH